MFDVHPIMRELSIKQVRMENIPLFDRCGEKDNFYCKN